MNGNKSLRLYVEYSVESTEQRLSGMNLDFIIPAKARSTRVPNKNWRMFAKPGQSLVSLTVDKLLSAGAKPERIFVSCEDLAKKEQVDQMGVQFLHRDASLCGNYVGLTEWLRAIVVQSGASGDVAWCQVCDPLFNQYDECLRSWKRFREIGHYDSFVVCHPYKGYLMTQEHQPIGWSFGTHHTPSQHLPDFYTMPFTLSILTQEAIRRTGYHIGLNPVWFKASNRCIDIDTVEDFQIAELYWKQRFNG